MTTDMEEIVTMIKDLTARIDLLHKSQARMRLDLAEHVYRLLKKHETDEQVRRRGREGY